MNILVIKQTSLGDVLHATGHIRTIRENYPHCHLTLLTATSSADIFRYSPHIDELLQFDRYRIKRSWYREPLWTIRHIREVLRQVRNRRYDLAIDLQGRWKSVLFLYGAKAQAKYVKGRWWFVKGFRQRELHALREMDAVLELAGMTVRDSRMEFPTSDKETSRVDHLLRDVGGFARPLVILSPFTRWPSKNWPIGHYASLAEQLSGDLFFLVTGSAENSEVSAAQSLVDSLPQSRAANLAGRLSLLEFAELIGRAKVVVTGDSFPMHLAAARGQPLVALFGPTDETRVGPVSDNAVVLRADDRCRKCYQRRCSRQCLERIGVDRVATAVSRLLVET